jgi:hypothetical protein
MTFSVLDKNLKTFQEQRQEQELFSTRPILFTLIKIYISHFSQWAKMYYFPFLIWYPFSITDLNKFLCLKKFNPKVTSIFHHKQGEEEEEEKQILLTSDRSNVCMLPYTKQRQLSENSQNWNHKIHSQMKNEIFFIQTHKFETCITFIYHKTFPKNNRVLWNSLTRVLKLFSTALHYW